MNGMLVTISAEGPVTTSLVITEGTGLEHASVIKLVRTYQVDFEEFGLLDFKSESSGGRPTEFAMLNERQTTLLMTYMRNSEIIRDFKIRLVKAFYELAKNNALGMAQTVAISELQQEVAALHAKINAFGKPIQRISNAQKNASLEDDILNAVKSEVDGNEYIAFSQLHNAVERHHNNSSPLSPRKTATALSILGYYFLTRCWVNGHRERIWTSACLAPSVTDAKKYVAIKLLA